MSSLHSPRSGAAQLAGMEDQDRVFHWSGPDDQTLYLAAHVGHFNQRYASVHAMNLCVMHKQTLRNSLFHALAKCFAKCRNIHRHFVCFAIFHLLMSFVVCIAQSRQRCV